MVDTPQDVKAVFAEAIAKRSPQEQAAYLDVACGSDTQLRAEVESLISAHQDTRPFLQVLLGDQEAAREDPPTEGPGSMIGRYKLLEKIGEGGMAVVYMAEQQEPLRRKVALKIIKLGMDTRQVIARFEAERQALALMDHPSIAKVLDAGATETGRPYFVMELVQGVSITEYCDRNSLSTKERLALFLQVCHAVQHAHQKGIIHRDIKPSNVMVTHRDGEPIPKVIDFGIAKATNQKLTEKTLFTRYAHLIGTPAYMSPEQAELSDLDIDTRSDIYSLGVLLYELLTGTTPFSEEELRKAGYVEMQRVIREQEPVKPSAKLTTLGEILTEVAKHRSATPDLLRRAVRGDLDWIVMKSLEKDRARRYETADALGMDVQRHLGSEPVLARGPGATYRLQKFLHRHRVQAGIVLGMVATAAAVGVILSIWNRDRVQLAEAEGFRHRGILSQAREQYAKAERDAALETIKPVLGSKHVGPEAQLLQAGILVDNRRSKEAVTVLNSLLNERPEIAGAAHSLLARILWESESLDAGKLKEIEEHRQKAEALLPKTAEAYFLQAMTAPTVKEQLDTLDKALELDPQHFESRRLRAFTYYASRKYERMKDDALVMAASRPRDPLGSSLRAIALRELGKYGEAIVEYDKAMALTPKDRAQYLDLSLQRCETFLRMGDYEHVIAETQASLKRWPEKRVFQHYLFGVQTALGDYDAARKVFRQIIRSGPEARGQFDDWCAKYVFDTLEAGRAWHPADREPVGAAFLPLVEAEETYRILSVKARPLTVDGFSAQWSPDGKKLAFSLGVHGHSGIALYDPATRETDLLVVPGKDPKWSPDGKYIAFVRDCQALRLEELTSTERKDQNRMWWDEEVWLMNADGTDLRRLVQGSWPSWSADPTCVYYCQSWADQAICSIRVTDPNAKPKRIVTCLSPYPSLSPDGRRLAYVEGECLKVKDLASQTAVAQWKLPFPTSGGVAWSPKGDELCLGGHGSPEKRAGLWLYRFDRPEPVEVLGGEVNVGCWSPEGNKLVFNLGPPFREIWAASLDPNVPLVEALGPARTRDEHFQELVALWTRRIEADPTDPASYAGRAGHYRSLGEEAKARADTWRWWAALHPGLPADFRLGGPWSIMHATDGPFDYQLVVFLERQEDGMQLLRIAFGQKGSGETKLFDIPMVVTSLLGLCLLPNPQVPAAQANFTFGPRVLLEPPVNSDYTDSNPTISRNGLELYSASNRPDGYGNYDIWMSKRARLEDPWGPPVNLGPGINSAGNETPDSISSDGLTLYLTAGAPAAPALYTTTRPTIDAPWGPRVNMGPVLNSGGDGKPVISPDDLELYFYSLRPGGLGGADIYVSTRATRNNPWGPPVNLGPTINTAADDAAGAMSPDGLILFILSNHVGGLGGYETWMTWRSSKGAPWSAPVNLGPSFNTPNDNFLYSVSADGRWAYIAGFGRGHLWMAAIIPPLISTSP
jgi:tetratricopeptide (TPR) repeat protein